jgi:hypothetical protein
MMFDIEQNKAYLRDMLNDAEKERKNREIIRSLFRRNKTEQQDTEETDNSR